MGQDNVSDWPMTFTSGGDQVQIFKPQPETFDGTSFSARAAVALQRPGDANPIFGALWGSGVLAVDRVERKGTLSAFKVTDIRFPGITDDAERLRIQDMLSAGILRNAPPISIDWLVAALEEEKQASTAYNNTPPDIIYREKPGILLFIDGKPLLKPVEGKVRNSDPVYAMNAPDMERVVNTPFFVVRPKGGAYWLYGSGLWYSAQDINGPWRNEKKAPPYVMELAASVDSTYSNERTLDVVPEIVVTTKPAVLLDLNGPPQLQPYGNGTLMYATNTDQDLFLDIPSQDYYLLASGRWYATKDLRNGPWRYVSPDALPIGFAQVPEGSAKDGILAHVAGTDAAREAVRDASIPQTARVDRRTTTVSVSYDGAPEFTRINGTDVYSAVNASTVVLRIKGRYYVVDNAVWFEGNSPDGPWEVSTAVPAEVNSIPPSDPNYRVRYVYIYDHTPDVVFTGYTPGYLGSYVQAGTVIYGTGFQYDPWWNSYWYPRPYTWGFHMSYNPWYGWGFGATWGYNWFYPGWIGYYRPYSWGWWGPYAYCPPIATWYGHPHYWNGHYWPGHGNTGYYGHRPSWTHMNDASGSNGRPNLRPTDLYRNRPSPGVTPSVSNGRAAVRTIDPSRTTIDRTAQDRNKAPQSRDYFTDRQGNIYRTENGATEKLQDGKWNAVPGRDAAPAGRDRREAGDAPPLTRPGTQTDRQPERQPANDPGWIQRERMRGDQREKDFKGYQQEQRSPQRMVPPTSPGTPQRVAPSTPRTAPANPRPSTPQTRPTPPAPNKGSAPAAPPSPGRSRGR